MNMNEMKIFIRMPAVVAATGLARSTIYQTIKAGSFPAPIQIGPRAVAWDQRHRNVAGDLHKSQGGVVRCPMRGRGAHAQRRPYADEIRRQSMPTFRYRDAASMLQVHASLKKAI